MNKPTALNPDSVRELTALAEVERARAEATLGRPLIDPLLFAFNTWRHGLAHALNTEHDLIP